MIRWGDAGYVALKEIYMKTVLKTDFFLSILFWCVSFVKICIGSAEVYDYIVIVFSTSIIVYDIDRMIKKRRKQNGKDNEDKKEMKN